jgi:hypothetical protein
MSPLPQRRAAGAQPPITAEKVCHLEDHQAEGGSAERYKDMGAQAERLVPEFAIEAQ